MTVLLIISLIASAGFAYVWWQQRAVMQAEREGHQRQQAKDAEIHRRIHRRAELLHRLVDGIDDGLFIIDGEMRIIFVNLGAQYFFPPVTEPVGRKLLECVPHQRIIDIAERSFSSGYRVSEEVQVSYVSEDSRAEDRIYQVLTVPLQSEAIHSAEGEMLLILRDETDKHTLEKIRKDFVANASHELRTPLSIIIGYLENLMEGDLTQADEINRAFTVMKKHGDRLAHIVEDLLVISRMESGQETALRMAEFDLHDCAMDVIQRLSPVIAAKSAQVNVRLEPQTDARLRGDRFYWDQILFNLVQNALKENQAQGLQVEVAMKRDNGTLQVEIRDNGVGIPQADLPFVFKRFYRVMRTEGREVKGTGLGLSIVKRAVEAHKGNIELRSKPGVETVFTIRVPHGM